MIGGLIFLVYFLGAMLCNYLIIRTWGTSYFPYEYPELREQKRYRIVALAASLVITFGGTLYGVYLAALFI